MMRWAFVWTAIGTLTACGGGLQEEEVGPRPEVVARIDSLFIEGDELRLFAEGIPAGLRPHGRVAEVRRQYLRSLLSKYLLQWEAQERGLDTASVVQAQVESRWRSHLVQRYRREVLTDAPEVSDAEVRDYIERHSLHLRRKLAGILVDDRDTAEHVAQRLGQGEDFGELARRYSLDERSVAQEGVLGFVSPAQARRLRIPDELFRSLPVGQISEVLPLGSRFQVIRFVADSLASIAEFMPQVRDLLEAERRAEWEWRHVQLLAEELEWRMDPDGRDLLLEKAADNARVSRRHLSPQEADLPLFVYRGGQIPIGDFLDAVWRTIRRDGLPDSAAIAATAQVLMGPALFYQAAIHLGIADRPEEQAWLAQVRTELAIKELRRREALERASVREAEARDFYRKNTEVFRTGERFYIVEILLETESEVRQALAELERGETLSSLAAQWSIRPEAQESDGLMHVDERERLTQPQFYQAVQQAPSSKVVGPVQVEDGYSLFEVLHREGGEVQPFEEVERRARAFVRQEKRTELFEALIDTLMAKYADRLTVYRSGLAAALPDTLLARLGKDAGS